jgi:hypothetical protein
VRPFYLSVLTVGCVVCVGPAAGQVGPRGEGQKLWKAFLDSRPQSTPSWVFNKELARGREAEIRALDEARRVAVESAWNRCKESASCQAVAAEHGHKLWRELGSRLAKYDQQRKRAWKKWRRRSALRSELNTARQSIRWVISECCESPICEAKWRERERERVDQSSVGELLGKATRRHKFKIRDINGDPWTHEHVWNPGSDCTENWFILESVLEKNELARRKKADQRRLSQTRRTRRKKVRGVRRASGVTTAREKICRARAHRKAAPCYARCARARDRREDADLRGGKYPINEGALLSERVCLKRCWNLRRRHALRCGVKLPPFNDHAVERFDNVLLGK